MSLKNFVLNVIGLVIAGLGLIPFLIIGLFMIAMLITEGYIHHFGWLVVTEIGLLVVTMVGYMIMPWFRNKLAKETAGSKERGERWAKSFISKADPVLDNVGSALDRMNASSLRAQLKKLEEKQARINNTTGIARLWAKMNCPLLMNWQMNKLRKDINRLDKLKLLE